MKAAGFPDAVVRSIIGHSTSRMSEHYSHIDPRNLSISWDEHVI